MKLILTQEVTGLGTPVTWSRSRTATAATTSSRALAVAWTKGGEKQVASIQKARGAREIKTLDEAQAVKARLESKR